jgi:hypothetical protein
MVFFHVPKTVGSATKQMLIICTMYIMKASLFADVGRYDKRLAVTINDVDLCVRLRQRGLRLLWTPTVRMAHQESAWLGVHNSPELKEHFEEEVKYIKCKWGRVLEEHPFYNPNPSLQSGRGFQLAFLPRLKRARQV